MPCPFADDLTKIRRRDRAVDDDAWIRDFLHRAPHGVLAVASGDQPFANMNIFVYDPVAHAILLHTARNGRTRDVLTDNPRVCFSVAEMGRLLPADEAIHFSVEYAGVIAFGNARIVEDPDAATRALDLLMRKYAPHLEPGKDYRPVEARDLVKTSVIEVRVEAWSAKRKTVDEAPGAYRWDDLPGSRGLPAPNGSGEPPDSRR